MCAFAIGVRPDNDGSLSDAEVTRLTELPDDGDLRSSAPCGSCCTRRAAEYQQQPRDRLRLVEHSNTTTTETVYRHEIRRVVQSGAVAMDKIFTDDRRGNPRRG
jgi:hypothetical protein